MLGDKVAAITAAARTGLGDGISKVKKYMSDLWGRAVPPCPKVVKPEGAKVPTLADPEKALLEKILATQEPISTEAICAVMSIVCEDVAEQEILFAFKFYRLTTVFAKAMQQLHLTEKKLKKLTDGNVKLASELRTVVSDYELFAQCCSITKLFSMARWKTLVFFCIKLRFRVRVRLGPCPQVVDGGTSAC